MNYKNLVITERSEKSDVAITTKNGNNLNNNNKKDLKEQLLSTNTEMKEIVHHMMKINEDRESDILASANNNTIQINLVKDSLLNTNTNINIITNTTNSQQLNQNLLATNNNNNNNNNISPKNSVLNQSNLNTNNQKDFQKSKQATSHNNNRATHQSILILNTEAEASNNFHSKNFFMKNNIQNLDEDDFNKYHKKLEEAKRKFATITVDSIFAQWAKMHEQYFSGMKSFFKNLRKQKENIIFTFKNMQEKYVEFLRRPSRKMLDINRFQKKYNKFFDEYIQLRGDEQVKAEFHQDVSDLSDRIWEAIEERKAQAIAERRKIMESGFVQKEMEKFYFNLEKLFTLEVEKYVTNFNTIKEFYYCMDFKNINAPDNCGFSPLEVLKDPELLRLPICFDGFSDAPHNSGNANSAGATDAAAAKSSKRSKDPNALKANLAYDSEQMSNKTNNKINNNINNKDKNAYNSSEDKYPRVQKLFKNSIKLIIKLDENLKSLEKISRSHVINNLSSESSIRKMSRVHLRRNHESTFVEDKKEIFIYEEEMKNSLKLEKNKFKYRVTFLKFWAVDYFENLRKISTLVYDKLDDWVIATIKAENDALNNLVAIFGQCIDKEMRLRVDFEMDSFEIYKLIDINDKIEIFVRIHLNLIKRPKFFMHLKKFALINISSYLFIYDNIYFKLT